MAEDKIMLKCFLCGREFQFGPHRYDGRGVPKWGITICRTCDDANWDGIVLANHPGLKRHLETRGIPITLNAKGWLDIPH